MEALKQRVLVALVRGTAEELALALAVILKLSQTLNKAAELNVNSKLGHPVNDNKIN
jgi:hypothetical protein